MNASGYCIFCRKRLQSDKSMMSENGQLTKIGSDTERKSSLKTEPQIGPSDRADVAGSLRAPHDLHLPTPKHVGEL
jgi:hypothetical protein